MGIPGTSLAYAGRNSSLERAPAGLENLVDRDAQQAAQVPRRAGPLFAGAAVEPSLEDRRLHLQGALYSGRLGPNRATMGVGVAAAMCIGPLSGPTKSVDLEIASRSSIRLSSPAREPTVFPDLARISSARGISSFEPTSATLTPGRRPGGGPGR